MCIDLTQTPLAPLMERSKKGPPTRDYGHTQAV